MAQDGLKSNQQRKLQPAPLRLFDNIRQVHRRAGGLDGCYRRGEGARAEVSAADSISGHPAPSSGVDQPGNLYNIRRWGAEYFDINDAGHVVAMPLRDAGAPVDLTDVIEEAKGRGLKFPLLIRFQDIQIGRAHV